MIKQAWKGKKLNRQPEPEWVDLANAYDFCVTFHCSLDEYDARPFIETQRMLALDRTRKEAQREKDEESQRR